jgi:hypothetical protein
VDARSYRSEHLPRQNNRRKIAVLGLTDFHQRFEIGVIDHHFERFAPDRWSPNRPLNPKK